MSPQSTESHRGRRGRHVSRPRPRGQSVSVSVVSACGGWRSVVRCVVRGAVSVGKDESGQEFARQREQSITADRPTHQAERRGRASFRRAYAPHLLPVSAVASSAVRRTREAGVNPNPLPPCADSRVEADGKRDACSTLRCRPVRHGGSLGPYSWSLSIRGKTKSRAAGRTPKFVAALNSLGPYLPYPRSPAFIRVPVPFGVPGRGKRDACSTLRCRPAAERRASPTGGNSLGLQSGVAGDSPRHAGHQRPTLSRVPCVHEQDKPRPQIARRGAIRRGGSLSPRHESLVAREAHAAAAAVSALAV